jgi:hypothetical protein
VVAAHSLQSQKAGMALRLQGTRMPRHIFRYRRGPSHTLSRRAACNDCVSKKLDLRFRRVQKISSLSVLIGTQDAAPHLSGMKPTKIFKKTPNKQRRPALKKRRAEIRAEYQRAREELLFGSLGAASPVRQIDPVTGDVIALIDPETRAVLLPVSASPKRSN